jgi:uncharacterized protein (DUF2141 family)
MKQAKNLRNYVFVLFILITNLSFKSQPSGENENLTVFVKNIRNDKGQIGFCLFNKSPGFPNHPEKAMRRSFVSVSGNAAEYTFTNIPFGTYAVCAFHDENNDQKINSNFIGIPKEGIGVSNNAKGHFGPPKFDDAKFNFSHANQKILITLTYL